MQSNFRILFRVSGAVLFTSVLLAGCSTDKKANAAQPGAAKEGSVPPRPAVIAPSTEPYRAVQVTGGAKLSGTVEFDGVVPRDSTITLPADHAGCGQTITVKSVENTGTRIGGAVVWITDIRSGKSLPLQKRFELVNEDCQLSPQVQAVVTSGTLNVASEDVAMHRDRIINVGTGALEGIAPFNDNGEVVPFDRLLDKPAQLEVICELHPWSKAHIVVVDHPYFAMTERSGSFSIDDVPPGTYHVKAWHPALGVAEQTVTIAAGQPASIALKLAPASVPAPAVDSQKGGV
jgi:Polysaccharide lyase family 4, domain II